MLPPYCCFWFALETALQIGRVVNGASDYKLYIMGQFLNKCLEEVLGDHWPGECKHPVTQLDLICMWAAVTTDTLTQYFWQSEERKGDTSRCVLAFNALIPTQKKLLMSSLQIERPCWRSSSTTEWWRSWSLTRTLASTMPWQSWWLSRLTKGFRT